MLSVSDSVSLSFPLPPIKIPPYTMVFVSLLFYDVGRQSIFISVKDKKDLFYFWVWIMNRFLKINVLKLLQLMFSSIL